MDDCPLKPFFQSIDYSHFKKNKAFSKRLFVSWQGLICLKF